MRRAVSRSAFSLFHRICNQGTTLVVAMRGMIPRQLAARNYCGKNTMLIRKGPYGREWGGHQVSKIGNTSQYNNLLLCWAAHGVVMASNYHRDVSGSITRYSAVTTGNLLSRQSRQLRGVLQQLSCYTPEQAHVYSIR